MGQFATGITVITAQNNELEVKGVTVNAFMSLSLDPSLIAISLRNEASIIDTLTQAKSFGISILSDEQLEYSMIFANQKKTEELVSFEYKQSVPVLPEALVQMICEKESEVKAGDHTIFIAAVKDLQLNEGKPLLYHGGQYKQLAE